MATRADLLRTVRLTAGDGCRYVLTTSDTGRCDSRGCSYIAYRLSMRAPGAKRLAVLFEGEDFAGSPLHADDSNETIAALMGFLTLQPGDTDPDYFASYTAAQLAWCKAHAESLQLECMARFGEDA